jgi:hypothetical protein
MRTELGELQVLDAHAHFFSQPFFLQFVRALQGDLLEIITYRPRPSRAETCSPG